MGRFDVVGRARSRPSFTSDSGRTGCRSASHSNVVGSRRSAWRRSTVVSSGASACRRAGTALALPEPSPQSFSRERSERRSADIPGSREARHRPGKGDDPLVRAAGEAAAAWLTSDAPDRLAFTDDDVVLGQGDCNLANFLWDGTQVRLVDFEDSGLSDRAFELAILVEHISAWSEVSLEADPFVALFDLTASERHRLREFRRLAAFFWLLLLLPGGPAFCRNPPGTLGRQAHRLLTLLG